MIDKFIQKIRSTKHLSAWLRRSRVLSYVFSSQQGNISGFNEQVLKVWHVYARTYNFGDHALGIGVRRLWRDALARRGFHAVFEVIDTHRFFADAHDIDRFNTEGGLVLVGGGGLIHAWDGLHWMFHVPARLLRRLKVPLCIFGVGYNQLKSQGALPACVRKNIAAVKNKSIGFTVRNDGSKERMADEGFALDSIPDPGFFLDGEYSRLIDRRYVIIQVAGDSLKERMSNPEQWYKQYAKCADWFVEQGLHVVFIPHCELDVDVTAEVIRFMGKKDYEMTDFWDGVVDEECIKILAYYKHAEFVIGSRGHAQIISFGMGTPFVTFSTHYKQKELSQRLGLGEFASNDPEKFFEMCKCAYAERNRIANIEKDGMGTLTKEMAIYMDLIVSKLLTEDFNGKKGSRLRRFINCISYLI